MEQFACSRPQAADISKCAPVLDVYVAQLKEWENSRTLDMWDLDNFMEEYFDQKRRDWEAENERLQRERQLWEDWVEYFGSNADEGRSDDDDDDGF